MVSTTVPRHEGRQDAEQQQVGAPLDIAFLFLCMAIGMACGTRFYAVAGVGTALMCGVILLVHFVNFGSRPPRREYLLSVSSCRSSTRHRSSITTSWREPWRPAISPSAWSFRAWN